jgi:hypothetical protein
MEKKILPRHTCAGWELGTPVTATCAQESMQRGEKAQQSNPSEGREGHEGHESGVVPMCISQTSGQSGVVERRPGTAVGEVPFHDPTQPNPARQVPSVNRLHLPTCHSGMVIH